MSLQPFWVVFKSGKAGCVEDTSFKVAEKQAEHLGGPIESINTLPYPATPRLSESKSECPPFCYSPAKCAGRTACPKSYACSE